jgi:hypothetical protein
MYHILNFLAHWPLAQLSWSAHIEVKVNKFSSVCCSYMFRSVISYMKMRVKQSCYKAGKAHRVPEGWGSQNSRQSAHEIGCQPYAPAIFTPQELFLVLISVRGWVSPRAIVRPEGLCHTIRNRTHDLTACSTVLLPTAPPCTPVISYMSNSSLIMKCYALFHSITSFGIIFWEIQLVDKKSLNFTKKGAIKIITWSRKKESCVNIFKDLGVFPFKSQYIFFFYLCGRTGTSLQQKITVVIYQLNKVEIFILRLP